MTDMGVDTEPLAPPASAAMPRTESPIVPKRSIAGRALVAVVAIMTFLASLTTGAVMMVRAAAQDWQSDVAREVTIQVRPARGRDLDGDVSRAIELARAVPGIGSVRALSKDESARLLEPWLGGGLALDDLPVPRMIVVKLPPAERFDFAPLKKELAEKLPVATLDDHRAWIERMRAMAQTSIVIGIGLLILMLTATMLSVSFATKSAMATNRPIVEVLHFIGAKSSFIVSQFQRHFLLLGLEGGLIGGGLAMLVFALIGLVGRFSVETAGGDRLSPLFGNFWLGYEGYLAILGQIVLIAAVTALASRRTVNHTLETVE